MRLKNKVVFLTGGSDGIGWACAKAYANEGATVILCGIEADMAKARANKLPGEHLGIKCDVSNENDVANSIAMIIEKYGRLDVIHNNAGVGAPTKPIHTTTMDEWDCVFNVNIKSVYLTTKYGFDALKASKGCILNTSSMAGILGQENHAAYTATKGAMNSLTKSMALDYAAHGIRVNAVCPAGTWTPMLREWVSEQADPNKMEAYLDGIHALGYCPEGDVIASASVYLISDDARCVTGTIHHVSGGAELGYRRI